MPGRNGRPPKPAEERLRTGTGHRPFATPLTVLPTPEKTGPDPARPLGQAGRELWDRVWEAGAHWLAPSVDCELLLIVCEQVDERAALRAKMFREMNDPRLHQVSWRDRSGLRSLDAQVMAGLSLLGFNPVDRARIGYAQQQRSDEGDDFFGRRSASGK